MSAVDNSHNLPTAPTTKESEDKSAKYVLTIAFLGLIALGVYQIFFCPACYATSDRTAVHGTQEP